jgi:dolichol-phosphate mannosyltransferase
MSLTRYDRPHRHAPMGLGRVGSAERSGHLVRRGGLAVIVPARNEAASLPRLIEEICSALRPLCNSGRLEHFEIVLVDDGSTDATEDVLRQLALSHSELRWISLMSNVGQTGAIAAGFRAAQAHWVATLDADLQNDPADLVTLWDALAGHDAALGWRRHRRDTWSKRATSVWANRVRNFVLGQAIRDTGCSVRIFPRELALRLPMFHGAHRFIGPLLLREGCRIVQLPVSHRPRLHGVSHYTFWNRSLRVIADLVGVAWLLRRPVRYQVVPRDIESPTGAAWQWAVHSPAGQEV